MSIIDRISAESPKFFKKLRGIAYTIFISGVAILGVSAVPGVQLDAEFIKVVSYATAVAAGVAGTSHLPKENE